MDYSTLLSIVGAVFTLSVIIVAGLCLNCKGNSQPKYITQSFPELSQMNSTFTVIRHDTSVPNFPAQPSMHPLLTSPLLTDPRRISACPSSDNESDYVNQDSEEPEPGYEAPPEDHCPDYLDVLPTEDDPHRSQQSLVSSANSGQNYENIHSDTNNGDDDDCDSDSQNYINVAEKTGIEQTPIGSLNSCNSDPDSSDYVNAPNQVNIHLI